MARGAARLARLAAPVVMGAVMLGAAGLDAERPSIAAALFSPAPLATVPPAPDAAAPAPTPPAGPVMTGPGGPAWAPDPASFEVSSDGGEHLASGGPVLADLSAGAESPASDALAAQSGAAQADGPPAPPNPVIAGVVSSFALPTGDLFVRKHDSALHDLLDGLTVGPGLTLPLNSHRIGDSSTGDMLSGSSMLTLGLHYQPVGYWFGQITVQAYLEKGKRAPWNGDFTYSFGYDDYHPYTFSLAYSNYSNNRFRPIGAAPVSQLDRGAITLAWKAPLPGDLARPFLIDQTLTINCRVGVSGSPRFDTVAGSVETWKTSANLDCNYPFTSHLFMDLNVLAYGHGQQPWDPDFTYSFGMADYRSDHFSIIYANYSGNRFPWRRTSPSTGHFVDGGVFINWNHGF